MIVSAYDAHTFMMAVSLGHPLRCMRLNIIRVGKPPFLLMASAYFGLTDKGLIGSMAVVVSMSSGLDSNAV